MEIAPVHDYATNVVGSSNAFVPLTIGPSFQQAFSDKDILRGFKLNIEEGENPFKATVFDGPVEDIPFTTQFTQSRIIESKQSFEDMIEVSGSLSICYGLISGSGAGEFVKKVVRTSRSSSIIYRTRHAAYAKAVTTAGGLTPVREAQEWIAQGRMDELTEKYGTKFVEQIVYGAQLDVVYTVTAREDTDLLSIMAELKAKIGIGPLSASIKAKIDIEEGQSKSELELAIDVKASGVFFTTPSNPSFEQTNDIIDRFNAKYTEMVDQIVEDIQNEEETPFLLEMSPIGFVLGSTADYVESLDQYESAVLDARMASAASVLQTALYEKARLDTARGILNDVYSDPRLREEIFKPYEEQVLQVMAEMDEKVDECLSYRRLNVSQIIGGQGNQPLVPVPTYVYSEYDQLINGYCGEGYIASPLTLVGETFEGIHYTGYTLRFEVDGILVPWMSGSARLDEDNSIVATGSSPEDLLENVVVCPRGDGWVLTYSHDENGNTLSGSFECLVKAIENGAKVQVRMYRYNSSLFFPCSQLKFPAFAHVRCSNSQTVYEHDGEWFHMYWDLYTSGELKSSHWFVRTGKRFYEETDNIPVDWLVES